jgi:hypothetical protein
VANYQVVTPKQLAQAVFTVNYATVYTCPAVTKTYLKEFDIVNTTATVIYVYVSIVPAAGTAGASNALFYYNALPGYSTLQWTGTQILEAGQTLQIKASAVGCAFTASGAEAV